MRALYFLLVLGGTAAAAEAGPSFDCTAATTIVEKTVCSDPALAALDQKMATAYGAALSRLSEPGRAALKEGQRQWLRFVRVLCTTPGEPMPKAGSLTDCLTDRYSDRLKQLDNATIVISGLTFRSVDSFVARKSHADDQPEWAPPLETLEISYPLIDAPRTDSEERFNAKLQSIAHEEQQNFADGGSDIALSADSISVSDKLISVSLTHSFYGHGAAHGLSSVSVVNWMRQPGRAMTAEDVFAKDTAWRIFLRDYCYTKVKREGFVEKPDDLNDMPEDPSRWELTSEGLTINFNVYEVASYADGIQQVDIPWNALKAYLADGAPVPPPSKANGHRSENKFEQD